MENSFGSIIETAKSILIILPTKPYFDQVAAGLGLYLSLRDRKETNIICPSEMTVEYNRLVGINKITREAGDKNLNITFAGYKAEDIEKVSCNVVEGEIVLTVVPKAGLSSPKKEQVNLAYSGVSADTVILVGGANETHFPALASKDLAGAKIIHVGIRALEDSGARGILSFARPASTTSELVAALIIESGLGLDADIATNLLAGIEEGSKSFKNPDVSADTFQITANLLRAGGRRLPQERINRNAFPPGAIPGEVLPIQPEKKEVPPKDWLEPKIYKGTSIS